MGHDVPKTSTENLQGVQKGHFKVIAYSGKVGDLEKDWEYLRHF
jgi:hypothetical protein